MIRLGANSRDWSMLCKELKNDGFLGCALNPCGYKKGGYINGIVMLDIHMLWVFKSK